jgi:hypothetical protein
VSAFIPNVWVDVLRGVTVDAYGDAADADAVVARGVPMWIKEVGRAVGQADERPSSTTPRAVRRFLGRARPDADVRAGDRLRVAGGGTTYQVEGVAEPADVAGRADLVCTLVRVAPAG